MGSKRKIAIVDDDLDQIEALKISLESSGMEVVSSSSENEAIEMIAKEMPHLVILDVMFPENPTTGFELCRAIKEDLRIKHIPVIILSAINEKINMAFTSAINSVSGKGSIPADFFMEKPIRPSILLAKINELVK